MRVCCSASLSDELVRLTSACQRDAAAVARSVQLESALSASTRRLEAALQIIGEKEDELEDLRADLAQAKQMFKTQIQQLADELTASKRNNGN